MSYPAMRRAERALTEEEAIGILTSEPYGVLSTTGVCGAYGIPINHVYADGHIYCHCAHEGHKLDNIAADNRVCFTVVERDPVIVAEKLTTRYRSAIAFGTAQILSGEEACARLIQMCDVLTPGYVPDILGADLHARVRVIDITVEHVTGKCNPA